jgi:CRP-like cAMP-binding protein
MAAPDKIAQLRAVPIFATLHDDALWLLAESASDFDAAAGQVLIQPDQPGNGLLILTEGAATVELGAQTIDCGAGECIGELSLLVDDLVHTARVRAATPVRGFAINRADFDRMIESDSRIALAMLRGVALRLVATDRLLTTKR